MTKIDLYTHEGAEYSKAVERIRRWRPVRDWQEIDRRIARRKQLDVPSMKTVAGYNAVFLNLQWKSWGYACVSDGGSMHTNGGCETQEAALLKAQEHIAFMYKFWQEKIDERDNPRVYRIGERHYYDARGEKPTGGFGGRQFRIFDWRTGNIVITNNLWSQGTIPTDIRDILTNNAEFIHKFDAPV